MRQLNNKRLRDLRSAVERLAPLLVWGTWGFLLVIGLAGIIVFGRNIPLAEDWTLVAPLTGNEPHFWEWLWSQNNEHRVPFPRLIFFGLLKISGGDFRVGMVYNVFILAGMAAASLDVASRLRNSQSQLVDMVFPLALMHWGHWPNLYWSWQLSYTTPVALIYGTLLVLLVYPSLDYLRAALFAGLSAILMPLCGAFGLIVMPFYTIWLGYCGWLNWRGTQRRLGLLLWGSGAIAIIISVFYFVGYEKPYWNPSSPGIYASLKATIMFTTSGLGPIAEKAWKPFVLVGCSLLLPAVCTLSQALRSQRDQSPCRTVGLGLFVGNLAILALAMGHGRAAFVLTKGLPLRYILWAVLAYLCAFYIWELYGFSKLRRLAQWFFLIVLGLLLPLNMMVGLNGWGQWYNKGMNEVEQDLATGVSFIQISERHNKFLAHWWTPKQLAKHMDMIKSAGLRSPFNQ